MKEKYFMFLEMKQNCQSSARYNFQPENYSRIGRRHCERCKSSPTKLLLKFIPATNPLKCYQKYEEVWTDYVRSEYQHCRT